MFKIIPPAKKVWIYGAAAALIIGSSSAMAYAMNNNIPDGASAQATFSAPAAPNNGQTQASTPNLTAGYTVVDLSKITPGSEQDKALKEKFSLNKNLSPAQVEGKHLTIIMANAIPGDKDISAEQAAAYAAAILEKAYQVDFTGYTAVANFSRNPVPNSDNWGVTFHAPNEDKTAKRYMAGVDSVNGVMLNAGCYDLSDLVETSQNLQDPAWQNKAVENIAKLLPEKVSIISSKVIAATPDTGVAVVANLSDGSAIAVRLIGKNKEATAYHYFPNGYDGSWDFHPVTADGVG